MKVKVKCEEIEGEGLLALLGKRVTLFCMNYIYTGKLVGVNETFIKLEKAKIVYQTGAFNKTTFEDAQGLPFDTYIQLNSIESYSKTDKV